MKNRIIALVVGMVLLLVSSLFSQLRIPEGLDFFVGAGRYWVNLKDTKSSSYYSSYGLEYGYYEMNHKEKTGYYIETGLEYRFLRINTIFHRYKNEMTPIGFLSLTQNPCL